MPTLMITHDVDDVQHWLASPKRDEFFAAHGMSVRTFTDPEGSKVVGVLVEAPDMATFETAMETQEAAQAMQHDGVHPDSLRLFLESSA